MAFTCGFFNSENGDRKYNAEQISAIFDGIIADGVFTTIGDHMAVSAGTGMQVLVGTGKAWFDHTWNVNDAAYPLAIAASDVTLSRIDAIVLETNHSDSVRLNKLRVVQGTVASTPVKPTLTNSENVHQHPLAWVTVAPGATQIAASAIENAVGTSACPFVTGIIETTAIDDLFNQWNGEFDEWFDNLKAQLSDNVVANLQKQIDANRDAIDKNGYRFEDVTVTYEDKFHTVEVDTQFPTVIYRDIFQGSRYRYGNTLYVIGKARTIPSPDNPELYRISIQLFGYDFETDNKVLDIDIGEELWTYVKSKNQDANIVSRAETSTWKNGYTKEMISWLVLVEYRNKPSSSSVSKYYQIYFDVNTHKVNFEALSGFPGALTYICNNRSINMISPSNKNAINISDRTFRGKKSIYPSDLPGVGSDHYFYRYTLDNDILYVELYPNGSSAIDLHYYSKDYGNTWTKINFPNQGSYDFRYSPIDELMYFTRNAFKELFSFDGVNLTQIDSGFLKPSNSNSWELLFNDTTLTFSTYNLDSGAVYKLINGMPIKIAEVESPYVIAHYEFILEDGSPIYLEQYSGIVYRGVTSGKRKVFKGSIPYGILYENYTLGAETPLEILQDTKLVTISKNNGVIYRMFSNILNGVADLRNWPTSGATLASGTSVYGVVIGNSQWVSSGSSGSARPSTVPVTIKYQAGLPDRRLIGFDTDCSISLVRMIKKG